MTELAHAVVWVDHHQAQVWRLNLHEAEASHIHGHPAHRQTHHKAGTAGSGHNELDKTLCQEVIQALQGASAILLTGPGIAKKHLHHVLEKQAPQLAQAIVGTENLEHVSDSALLTFGRDYFAKHAPIVTNFGGPAL